MGKLRILGDFAELEEKLARGEITQDEYQKIFEQSRYHGMDNSIFPFAVGGSDAAIIMGESPWRTPLRLYNEKFGLLKEKNSFDKEMMFLAGHLFEAPIRDMFAKKKGLRTEPCTLQVSNSDYPHLVANIDGLVWEGNEMGIYEGKTTSPFSDTREYFCKEEVPIYYYIQVQFYLEVWNLNFAYINCAWGLNWKNDMKDLRIERDRDFGREICQACEKFVTDAAKGIRPNNSNVADPKVLAKDNEVLFGVPDLSLPPVEIPSSYHASFEQLDRLAEEKEKVKTRMEPFELALKDAKDDLKPYEKELKEIEKQETEILRIFTSIIGNATKGCYKNGDDVYTVTYDPATGYSLDASVKKTWQEKYPECFKDITSLKPNLARQLSYEKGKAN